MHLRVRDLSLAPPEPSTIVVWNIYFTFADVPYRILAFSDGSSVTFGWETRDGFVRGALRGTVTEVPGGP